MAKKNTDGMSFNRTGLFNFEKSLIQTEDKEGIKIFDLVEKLKQFDGYEISISVTTDIPAAPLGLDELNETEEE